MSVRNTSDEAKTALYCSITGLAFGPVFDDGFEADDFLEWLSTRDPRDPREIPQATLVDHFKRWQDWREREPSDVEMFGAGAR